jgi:hypothetical protein
MKERNVGTWNSYRSDGASWRSDANDAGGRQNSRSILIAKVDRLYYASVIAFAIYLIAMMVG